MSEFWQAFITGGICIGAVMCLIEYVVMCIGFQREREKWHTDAGKMLKPLDRWKIPMSEVEELRKTINKVGDSCRFEKAANQ